MESRGKFQFAIDRGGTFTDVFARCPDGQIKTEYFDISFGYPNQFMESFIRNKVIFDEKKTALGKRMINQKLYKKF